MTDSISKYAESLFYKFCFGRERYINKDAIINDLKNVLSDSNIDTLIDPYDYSLSLEDVPQKLVSVLMILNNDIYFDQNKINELVDIISEDMKNFIDEEIEPDIKPLKTSKFKQLKSKKHKKKNDKIYKVDISVGPGMTIKRKKTLENLKDIKKST